MNLPKIFKTNNYFNFKFILGKRLLINLDNESQITMAFPKLVDVVMDNKNREAFSNVDLHQLKLEMVEIGQLLMLIKDGDKNEQKKRN